MSLDKVFYAVAEVDGPVFGIGESQEEAISDAVSHHDVANSEQEIRDLLVAPETAQSGDLFVAEATPDFIDEVRLHGGDIEYDANADGELVGV